jgi:pimeloyl-ACP methyl ester carboxylesterase
MSMALRGQYQKNKIMNYSNSEHLIILLHGIGKNSSSLKGLKTYLNEEDFSVLNINYPSTKYPIEELSNILHNKIHCEIKKYKMVSFVCFSMGGLVIRAYCHKYKIPNLGKVVMIGSPNKGSEVADFFKNNIIYKKFFGPAGHQLSTNQQYLAPLLGNLNCEFGIIAGNLSLDFYYFLFKGAANDGKVSVKSTKLENMNDHIVIKVPHWYMPRSKTVWKLVLNFLKYSKFNTLEKNY